MKKLFKLFFLFLSGIISSQDIQNVEVKVDSLYREDQFYFGFTYNTFQNKPAGLVRTKFSKGFSTGFLRDMPINKMRTIAFATGIGFSYNNFNQNILISEYNQNIDYSIIDSNISFKRNRFSQFLIDFPVEFRWRSSNFNSHKFWRIHSGFKFSYLLNNRSIYEDNQTKIKVNNNSNFNKINYGVYLTTGYNTINVYGYYGLNTLFQFAKINDESIDLTILNLGIIFYIL